MFISLFREQQMVRNFRILNARGFDKICKKFDKLCAGTSVCVCVCVCVCVFVRV